jgi:hypothetical protein
MFRRVLRTAMIPQTADLHRLAAAVAAKFPG